LKRIFLVLLILALIALPLLEACAAKTSSTAALPPSSAPAGAASAPTTSASQPKAPPVSSSSPAPTQPAASSQAPKVLKIGTVSGLGWPIGLDMKNVVQLLADLDKQKGGIDIGGQKYQVQIISYDSNMTQTGETAAINRLIFEDQVKYIMNDGLFLGAWISITDANKVLVCAGTMDYKLNMNPNLQYSFNPSFVNGNIPIITGWFCKNYPDLVKNLVVAYPDSQQGHMSATNTDEVWAVFGVKTTNLFYPSSSGDLSSLGTKVKTLNPACFMAVGGGPALDGLAIKSVWQAGYRGQYFASSSSELKSMVQVIPLEVLEGSICGAPAIEFDPPLTEPAKAFKEAWVAKYGKWEGQQITGTVAYSGLKTAFQQAGSVDTGKVAEVLANGLKFDSPNGYGQMISRLDLGNTRTTDSITTTYIKQVVNGNPKLIATIDLEEGLKYFRMVYPPSDTFGSK
jgi:branched-chain amino acid transport system substrate-binding protein